MSLLSNLLNFSSLVHNNSEQKEQRSSSASSRFMFQLDSLTQNKRTLSKSLSKLGLISNGGSKIDPKQRYLHRITHSLSMKVRKHYYAFFVTLEAISKASIQNKNNNHLEKITAGLSKIEQTLQIYYSKVDNNVCKDESFTKIKIYSYEVHLIKTLSKIYENNVKKMSFQKLLLHFKSFEKMTMKIQLLQSALTGIAKTCNQMQIAQTFKIIKQSKIANTSKRQKTPKKQISVFQLFGNMQKKIDIFQQQQKIKKADLLKLKHNSTDIEQVNQKNYYSARISENLNDVLRKKKVQNQKLDIRSEAITFTINPINQSKFNSRNKSLENSPLQSYRSKSKSPFKNCRIVANFRQNVQFDSIQSKNYQKVGKSYKISCNIQQEPFSLIIVNEQKSKILTKLSPQQPLHVQIQDLVDKSQIFRAEKDCKAQVCEISPSNHTFSKRQSLNVSNVSNIHSQIQLIPYDSSLSIIGQREESSFGCDAVNFKNSLVMERESMKKSDRERVQVFLKKRTIIHSQKIEQHQHLNMQAKTKLKNQMPYKIYKDSYSSSHLDESCSFETNRFDPNQTQIINLSEISMSEGWKKSNKISNNQSVDKNKSISLVSSSNEVARKLVFNSNNNSQQKIHRNVPHHLGKNAIWKKQTRQSEMQMPVRDIQPISKNKNNCKFISINKK